MSTQDKPLARGRMLTGGLVLHLLQKLGPCRKIFQFPGRLGPKSMYRQGLARDNGEVRERSVVIKGLTNYQGDPGL